MKNMTVLYLDDCPYCRNARRAMEEWKAASPEYAGIDVEWIEESRQPERAEQYANDYYYVPSIFVEGKKVYEAHPGESYAECREHVGEALRIVCS